MSEPEKLYYKVKYEFETEITAEITEDDGLEFQISVTPKTEIQKTLIKMTGNQPLFNVFKYIEKHFPEQVDELYRRMFVEGVAMCLGPGRSYNRKKLISRILQEEANGLRKRLVIPKGAIPNKDKGNYSENKKQFILECGEILKNLQSEGEKLTRTDLAEILFDTYSNPLRELRKRLKLYEITFEDLIKRTDQ